MIQKIIEYQVRNKVTDSDICDQIGIGRKTFYNIRVEGKCSSSTQSKIENFIEKKGL